MPPKIFKKYLGEDLLKTLLKDNPKPSHSFLKVEEMDPSIENGLPDKICKTAASVILNKDKTLKCSQEKVLQVMGPMGSCRQSWIRSGEEVIKNISFKRCLI